MKIGLGYDIHRLTEGRKLIIGGVEIPFAKGLEGHSDADVLLHAITDAILGAAGLRDIGSYFPDTDPAYKDADSRVLLRKAMEMARRAGFYVINIDATVVAEQPRLSLYIDEMIKYISDDLNVEKNQVMVKATTSEKMGMVGRGEGISAIAVCLLGRT
ncbi:2-C-methyl-D-erythritol 2,4-cyclodiphosphate synthase [Balneolaceae bacterium ANBcel3]|nr:2-C-methyl-D-erythritol 2,4-cyclodiphosphate synthase [Balneolaceae bacterium ANBcel3]